MISTHSLSAGAFTELAVGAGDSVVVRQLREAQLSKHLMLLHALAESADERGPRSAAAAFRAGYRLLADVQRADPDVVSRLLGSPHIGSWAHHCLGCLDKGLPPDFGYLAAAAAAAAIAAGAPFELAVPARDGCVVLPGLGSLRAPGQGEWVRLSSDGERLQVGGRIGVDCAALVPDGGATDLVPHWRGTPLVRAVADGQVWEVRLETVDRHLDRYHLPMLTTMTASAVAQWRRRIRSAWELLVRHHDWAAGPIAAGVSVIVPLVPRSDLDSATSQAAFGAIATSLPRSPASMAETLIHEFQHSKLCGLMDMLPLIEMSGKRGYAPWREDPRPMGGLLQGVYAFAGIVRFHDVQRRIETDPGEILRSSVLYERWRSTIEPVAGALLDEGILTPTGIRFVTELRDRVRRQESVPVPAEAAAIAREIALDNWLTWQMRHTALDPTGVADLADAYRRGESLDGRVLPAASIEDDIRKVDSIARSRLLNTRFQDPQRYQQLCASGPPELGPADALLARGDASAAVAAYCEGLAAEPDPAAWIGLALAVHRRAAISAPKVFATHLPLLFEMHACLADQGIQANPLDLAAWFE